MPNCMYTCVVCETQVSHRKSYAYEKGRACRHHQEVIDMAKALKVKNTVSKHSSGGMSYLYKRAISNAEWGKKHCWICGTNGTPSSEYWNAVVVAFKNGRAHYTDDLFEDPEFSNNKILIAAPNTSSKSILRKVDRRMVSTAISSGMIRMCPCCARDNEINPGFLLQAKTCLGETLVAEKTATIPFKEIEKCL